MKNILSILALAFVLAAPGFAQTPVIGGGGVDSGPTLPATCSPGALFSKTADGDPNNIGMWECRTANNWTKLGGGGTGLTSLNALTASSQSFAVGTAGTAPAWSSVTSTHTLNIPMATTAGVTAGLVSKAEYDAKANASVTLTGGAGIAAIGDLSTNRTISVDSNEAGFLSTASVSCGAGTAGKFALVSGASVINFCNAAGTPAQAFLAIGNSNGEATAGDSATGFFAAGTLELARLPTALGVEDENNTWTLTNVFSGVFRGPTGTALPGTCTIGDEFFDTDATAGRNKYGCTATNTWTLQGDGGGSITGTDTHVTFFDGANNAAGDAGFTYNKTTDRATLVGGLTVTQGTITASAALLGHSATLNNSGVDFFGLDLQFTVTAAGSGTRLMRVRCGAGGTTVCFELDASGNVNIAGALTTGGSTPYIELPDWASPSVSSANTGRIVYVDSASRLRASLDGAAYSDIALASDKLSFFAATNSAELAGVLSDESGSGGGFVRATGPTISGLIGTGTANVSEALQMAGDIAPAQITADQNDYNPSGLSTSTTLRLSTDASRNLTGLAGGADGRILHIHNVGAQPIVLVDESASSTAGNRFALNANITVGADQGVALQYDSTSSRWRVYATSLVSTATGVPNPSANGMVACTGTSCSTSAARTITGTANEVAISNGDGVAGNPTISLDADIGALGANSTNGLWARTGAGTGSARTITGTTNEVVVSNGDGGSGNPTISLDADIGALGANSTNGFWARTGAGTGAARTFQSSSGGALSWTNGDGVSGNPTPVLTTLGKIWLEAAACENNVAGGQWDTLAASRPTPACDNGTNTVKGYLDFPDTDGDFAVQRSFPWPADWTGAVDAKIYWKSTATTGDVVWQVATICVADGETEDPSFNAAQDVVDTTKGTGSQVNTVSQTSLTLTGCAAGEIFFLRVLRNRTHASDTLGAAAARFRGVEITNRRAQ